MMTRGLASYFAVATTGSVGPAAQQTSENWASSVQSLAKIGLSDGSATPVETPPPSKSPAPTQAGTTTTGSHFQASASATVVGSQAASVPPSAASKLPVPQLQQQQPRRAHKQVHRPRQGSNIPRYATPMFGQGQSQQMPFGAMLMPAPLSHPPPQRIAPVNLANPLPMGFDISQQFVPGYQMQTVPQMGGAVGPYPLAPAPRLRTASIGSAQSASSSMGQQQQGPPAQQGTGIVTDLFTLGQWSARYMQLGLNWQGETWEPGQYQPPQ